MPLILRLSTAIFMRATIIFTALFILFLFLLFKYFTSYYLQEQIIVILSVTVCWVQLSPDYSMFETPQLIFYPSMLRQPIGTTFKDL